MSYLVLARKYRPQAFDEVIGQEHVTQTLENAIVSKRVAHAILFTGPRGTGKTTIARILAKAMNCEKGPAPAPCNACRSCNEITASRAVDVFEIDGASNNSVDQIRELRENVKYVPVHSKYKIYIIDEVHMLSIAAFNALLKTLEEPPAHVMFLFATTEPHKIPITILSRCQRHDLRRVSIQQILDHLKSLCEKEQKEISEQSLRIIAGEAGGSVRDSLSLLDQVMASAKSPIAHERVLEVLNVLDRRLILGISEALLQQNVVKTLQIIDEVYNRGHDLKKLYIDLIEHFRHLVILKIGQDAKKLVDLPQSEIEMMVDQIQSYSLAHLNQLFDNLFAQESRIRFSADPKVAFEMTAVRMAQIKPVLPIDELISKIDQLRESGEITVYHQNKGTTENQGHQDNQNHPDRTDLKRNVRDVHPEPEPIKSNDNLQQEAIGNPAGDVDINKNQVPVKENLDKTWKKILDEISKTSSALVMSLEKSCLKNLTDQRMEIEVIGSEFACSMVNRPKNIEILKDAGQKLWGRRLEVQLIPVIEKKEDMGSDLTKTNELKQKILQNPLIADAIDIFNGKIVDIRLT